MSDRAEEEILRAVREVRYGAVEVVIHDGRIVQIEKKEKLRFDLEKKPGRTRGGSHTSSPSGVTG